ncbi:hypothetical protein SGFS_084810 [Streptomyces graminofaciens]|uniref:Uncharacterized protein n=1 Tax=Streptomyces graminofaciens TaxID=68212 RepID=A0ABM7FKX2_9ACTN|nr:hypothetical protein SGFS_084810 [Streptomyces graminofaciens]
MREHAPHLTRGANESRFNDTQDPARIAVPQATGSKAAPAEILARPPSRKAGPAVPVLVQGSKGLCRVCDGDNSDGRP